MDKYNHHVIEKKWQKYWLDKKTFKAEADVNKPKYYILDMFPYPSGAGLHVGHVAGYTGTDIIARYMRQKGYNVLHPMGWDAFGLPAEQYAIRTGQHPSKTTDVNIATYKRQLQLMGFSYDWDREIKTCEARYYKWTQWIFTKLYEKGLAYEAEINVNFCPALGTVLANEEVENGKAKEGGYPVVKKPLRQWVLKITEYADRLIEDLKFLDWPDNLKRLQTNWIGKSEGAKVFFKEKRLGVGIEVFTTRPDTLFGATYLVLAPEHPLVNEITVEGQKDKVAEYKKRAMTKSDLERTDLLKDKSGVWTGAYAINPVNKELIPIWISDYVMMTYGTGAIMAVPAHDERDFEFAKKFDLPITCVLDPVFADAKSKEEVLKGDKCWSENGIAINSSNKQISLNGLETHMAKEKMIIYLEEEGMSKRMTTYKLRDWLFSRQRYWGEPMPILHFEDGSKRVLDLDELPLTPPELIDYKPTETGESPLAKVDNWVNIIDPKTKLRAKRETNTMPQWAGSCWYYLRFIDPLNDQEAWNSAKEKYWMPVDLYVGGTEHAVLHLLYARFWHKVLYDCGLVSSLEPFKKYQYPGMVTAPSYKKEGGGYVAFGDVEEINGEYFLKGTKEKLICQIDKMSKSKLNGVSPDEIAEEFGADSLRLYEMFMGPFDYEKIWNRDAVHGCYRFLNRFFDMVHSDKVVQEDSEAALKLGHNLMNKIRGDIEKFQFNTAIAHLMEFLNDFTKFDKYPKSVVKMAVQALYPFAPHIAEELWQYLGEKIILAYYPLFSVDERYMVDDMAMIVVQVNGKLRGSWQLKKDIDKEGLLKFAKEQPQIKKYLDNSHIDKVIFVPGKLLNIVVKS
jgi:leucyl-tRNA synthetase